MRAIPTGIVRSSVSPFTAGTVRDTASAVDRVATIVPAISAGLVNNTEATTTPNNNLAFTVELSADL